MMNATIPRPDVAAWAHHVVHLRAARTFIEACESEGIPVLPVKGIVTAYTLYDDPAERAISDVDVRIRPRDYERVGALARRRGWRFVEIKRAYENYVLEVEGVQVDVECHVGPPHVCSLRIEDMLSRSTRSNLLGFECSIPDFTDHVVLQIVNVFKDKIVLAGDGAVEDLRRAARRHAFDPAAIASRLREVNAATMGSIIADHVPNVEWSSVAARLEPRHRQLYVRAWTHAIRRPRGLFAIATARVASDDVFERVRAIATMARMTTRKN